MTRIERALKTYEKTLKLTIEVEPDTPTAGQPFQLRFSLQHVGVVPEPLIACVGANHEYTVLAVPLAPGIARKPLDTNIATVDHPACGRRFTLRPSETLEWQDTARLDIGPGRAVLSGWIAVVHPTDCDQYGCYETHIEFPRVSLLFK
jgi:hypothetical protein